VQPTSAARRCVRVLLIEDDDDDAALIERSLRQGPCEPLITRIMDAESLRTELARGTWDVVLADGALPSCDAGEALALLKESGLDVPFLVVSGAIGEERAAQLMRAGAHDVVRKDQLSRLPGAVARELAEARLRREHRRALAELTHTSSRLATLVEAAPVAIIEVDLAGRVRRWNPAAERILGWSANEVMGASLPAIPPDQRPEFQAVCAEAQRGRTFAGIEVRWLRRDGEGIELTLGIAPLPEEAGSDGVRPRALLLLASDQVEMKRLGRRLDQAQRLESLGQLASGLSHEIGAPIQAASHDVGFLVQAVEELTVAVAACRELLAAHRDGSANDEGLRALAARVGATLDRTDIDYLLLEVPRVLGQVRDHVDRVGRIVRALREVSQPGTAAQTQVDLNRAVECTATIARNEFRHVADLVLDLQPELPTVPGSQAELTQALLNLLVNAAHAVGEATSRKGRGVITVSTRDLGDCVEVRVHDTGAGIPPQIRDRIFEPFFTTKPVGKGTGQGLPACRAIVERHRGALEFDSHPETGTSFVMRLPCAAARPL
jgi:PAS domain S-box-containing protein